MSTINASDYQIWSAVAKVLHNILYSYPSMTLISSFKRDKLASQWPELELTEREQLGRQALARYLAQWDDCEAQLIELKLDYGQLYFGPGDPKAVPWGSVYTSEGQLLNESSTQNLISFYKTHRIELSLPGNEPVDHIGLILLVLQHLLNELVANPDDIDKVRVCTLLLQQHLLPWADRCLELAELHAKTDFYRGTAVLARVFLGHLGQKLDVIPQTVKLYR
ncbi:molecular chaperone TorD family protein [Shewanella sp. M16]|uniref:TorD/DmsD family molecular chaperone n=1 Tax=Shewanella sp. M16 TaxID=2830837 RepID=UPI001BAE5816|nr:molecular chaperone TorD family protein [Shewanella sp. M16]MBS0044379.1 molecular chaperone TorD family protein [Shewanella sp. M16]